MFSGCMDIATSTFYSGDAASYKTAFGLSNWQEVAYE